MKNTRNVKNGMWLMGLFMIGVGVYSWTLMPTISAGLFSIPFFIIAGMNFYFSFK